MPPSAIHLASLPHATIRRLEPSKSAGTVILSPHPDDAALTVSGALQLGRFEPPVTIGTLFSRSNFTLEGGFADEWEWVTATRRSEDYCQAEFLGLKLRYYELPEATLRDDPIMCCNPNQPIETPAAAVDTLELVVRDLKPATLIAPLGLDCHTDHLMTERIVSGMRLTSRLTF